MKISILKYKVRTFVLICILNLCSLLTFAQDTTKTAKHPKWEARQERRNQKVEEGKFLISPVAAPAYTPELGGLLAVGGLTSFKTNPQDSLIQRSSLPFTIGYTTTGAIVAQALLSSYWFQDKLRIYGDFWYKDMPDHYWGVGYDNASEEYKSDSTTAYNRQWWWINPRFLFQVRNNFFIGLNIDYNYTQGSNASEGVANDPTYQKYNDKPFNAGFGLILRYDSRDIPVDAWEGIYFNVSTTFYSPSLGGDNQYQVYLIDYRQYQSIVRKGRTLAWQIKARFGAGDIPYGEMSQLGSPFDLRGYTWGRYRDKSMFYLLAEYRHMFLKQSGELSKHGAVGWIGSGTVFDTQTLQENTNGWLPNFGIGYRLEVQPRMHVRFDFGIGRETSGFYFNFNQAF